MAGRKLSPAQRRAFREKLRLRRRMSTGRPVPFNREMRPAAARMFSPKQMADFQKERERRLIAMEVSAMLIGQSASPKIIGQKTIVADYVLRRHYGDEVGNQQLLAARLKLDKSRVSRLIAEAENNLSLLINATPSKASDSVESE